MPECLTVYLDEAVFGCFSGFAVFAAFDRRWEWVLFQGY
jgi:hypothetical protein